MVYVDPKDMPAHPDWNPTYAAAWNERKRLRLEHLRVTKAIESMDQFLAMYEQFEAPKPPHTVETTITVSTSNAAGFCNTAQDGRPAVGKSGGT